MLVVRVLDMSVDGVMFDEGRKCMLVVCVFDYECLQLDTPQHATAVCTLRGGTALCS